MAPTGRSAHVWPIVVTGIILHLVAPNFPEFFAFARDENGAATQYAKHTKEVYGETGSLVTVDDILLLWLGNAVRLFPTWQPMVVWTFIIMAHLVIPFYVLPLWTTMAAVDNLPHVYDTQGPFGLVWRGSELKTLSPLALDGYNFRQVLSTDVALMAGIFGCLMIKVGPVYGLMAPETGVSSVVFGCVLVTVTIFLDKILFPAWGLATLWVVALAIRFYYPVAFTSFVDSKDLDMVAGEGNYQEYHEKRD
eukprot:Clim_evm7s213 gene=Clim_evmTU7s213